MSEVLPQARHDAGDVVTAIDHVGVVLTVVIAPVALDDAGVTVGEESRHRIQNKLAVGGHLSLLASVFIASAVTA
ncbi:hypothetical protein [Streptomyces sp. NPDC057301]|uniref:hypothetical protein n=1 Tax=Streptomyces sp. NPDC057301 TaxID=3346093 RepID=UPI00362A2762